jgi:hypothetical protein
VSRKNLTYSKRTRLSSASSDDSRTKRIIDSDHSYYSVNSDSESSVLPVSLGRNDKRKLAKQTRNRQRRQRKIKNDQSEVEREKSLHKRFKHFMSVEFSLTYKLSVILKYHIIEELLKSIISVFSNIIMIFILFIF